MAKLANRLALVKESPTLAVMAKASAMKSQGQDVVILAAGEPDFDTPEFIKQAAIAAINQGKTKYTNSSGLPELKQAIINKFATENNLHYKANQVLVSCGAKHSIFNALETLINPGDEVIIPAPFWVSYPDMVLLCDGVPKLVSNGIEDSFKISAAKLEQAITNKTKAIILNSPNNPTGMSYDVNELSQIAKVLDKHPNIYVICDDIYEHLNYTGNKYTTLANVAPQLIDRIIVVNGVSKSYAMTGWRIGYAACGDVEIIKAMSDIQSQSTSNPCSISQYAAVAALNNGRKGLDYMNEAFIKRHDYVYSTISQIKGLRCIRAQGAFYVFFDCSEAIASLYAAGKIKAKTDLAFANYLLEDYLLALVPGSAFGLDDHMRISFAASMEDLEKGLARIKQALD